MCRGWFISIFAVCFLALDVHGNALFERSKYNTRLWQMEEGLPNNIVQAITQTRDGYLWVGTREGLARFDGINFHKIDLIKGHPPLSISDLLPGSDNVLWVGTEDAGLFRLSADRVERCTMPNGTTDFSVHQ